jgi:parvulin-like peptidyl-prolyl isomerase
MKLLSWLHIFLKVHMKRISSSLALSALLAITTPLHAETQKATGPLDPSSVAAVVDGQSITVGDINRELTRPDLKAALDTLKDSPEEIGKLKSSVLSSMIDRELLIKAAKTSPSYKSEEIKKEAQTIIDEQGGRSVIQPILASYGTTWEVFEEDMQERLTIERYIEKDLLSSLTISDADLKAAFNANPSLYADPEKVRARHILIAFPKGATSEQDKAAATRAQEVYTKASKPGADFSKLAAEYSDDTASKVEGGELGFFERGMMVPEFEKAAFALKVGQISEPVKTNYGYHIIKVEEHVVAGAPDFEKAKEKIRYRLMAAVHDKTVMDKIAQLRKSAAIDFKIAELKKS